MKVHRALERQGPEKFALFLGQLSARIADGRERHVVEMLDLARLGGLFVVVALDDGTAQGADDLQAFAGVGIVANDVPDADRMSDGLGLHILQYGLQSLEVTVDVSKNAKSHANRPTNGSGKSTLKRLR